MAKNKEYNKYERYGRGLAKALRHDMEVEKEIDLKGFISLEKLNSVIDPETKMKKYSYTEEYLRNIIDNQKKEKLRFQYKVNDNIFYVRAYNGHTFKNKIIQMNQIYPNNYVYHVTNHNSVKSIMKNNLNSGNRQYIHLYKSESDCIIRGHRDQVIKIDAVRMIKEGYDSFFDSENGYVMYRGQIPSKYISSLK
jgi:RNA:NAD 2'-phosphotransferase (TPT1/KptA family)